MAHAVRSGRATNDDENDMDPTDMAHPRLRDTIWPFTKSLNLAAASPTRGFQLLSR